MCDALPSWLFDRLACVNGGCSGRLAVFPHFEFSDETVLYGILGCGRCGARYPILAGIPVLIPDPVVWMASFRESVLATLAEFDLLNASAVRLINGFAAQAGDVDVQRFGDDWVASEIDPTAPDALQDLCAEIGDPDFQTFLTRAGIDSPESALLQMAGPRRRGTVLEIGCGAGKMSPGLAALSDRLVVSDFSLRAVCLARQKVNASGQRCVGIVLDAVALPFSSRTVRLVVAQNLVDLLDNPDRFVWETSRILTPRGRFLISTPDPELLTAHDLGGLFKLLSDLDFEIEHHIPRVPWIRFHHSRHIEVYFTDVLSARPRAED